MSSDITIKAYKDEKNKITVDISPSPPFVDDADLRQLALDLEAYLMRHGWINTIRDESHSMKFPGVRP